MQGPKSQSEHSAATVSRHSPKYDPRMNGFASIGGADDASRTLLEAGHTTSRIGGSVAVKSVSSLWGALQARQ